MRLINRAGTPPTTVFADGHALQYGGVGTYPYVPAQHDGCGIGSFPPFRSQCMVECGKDHIMPNLASVAEGYSAVVLEMAAGVDEHAFTHGDVLSEIRVERRKHAERLRHFITEQFGKQSAYFVRRVVGRIQPERDSPRLVAHVVHEMVNLLCINRIPCRCVCLEIFYRHTYCLSNFTVISPPMFRASIPLSSICPILSRSLLCDQFLQKIATLPHGA